MADELNEVKPGDLITADQFNALIQQVKALLAAGGGPVVVPNLYGQTLASAKAILAIPGNNLVLGGNLLDAFGQPVDPNDAANQTRRVIGQVPAGGARVTAGTAVSLLMAAKPTTGGTTPDPAITAFSPLQVPVKEALQIIGKNFSSLPSDNLVTFNGTAAPAPSGQSSSSALFVIVPDNFPSAPKAGQPAVQVTVKVKTAEGKEVSGFVTVQAPTGVQHATLDGFAPSPPVSGQDLVITGTGFGATASAVKVKFSNEPSTGVTPKQVTPTSLTVTIPTNLSGMRSGFFKAFTVVVSVNGVESLPDANDTLSIYTP
ncbi:IPT/TIG domain-containing protein [Corallococcus llansteffanensis]|uniref:PASTA domain-containing protein n=1 Tax=Corallococcus llansteffanensis TaxID=2316731 RepID=A0A3A8PPY0_9BACT|nr:IPT/TIG domain-containing protein [Corallococcus llansteffanensis]RKH58487.1 PASTA domain-containing protein [Corallococcus llansteffanensis]